MPRAEWLYRLLYLPDHQHLRQLKQPVQSLRLVRFLNEMSRRHLPEFDGDLDTETSGGAWRWRHRIIQDYFLEAEKK